MTRTNYGKGQQKGSQTKVSPKPQSDETWPTLPKATKKPDQPIKACCNTKAMSKWTASKAGNSLWDDAIFSGEEAEKAQASGKNPGQIQYKSQDLRKDQQKAYTGKQIVAIKEMFHDMTVNGTWTEKESREQFERLRQKCFSDDVHKVSKTCTFWRKGTCKRVDCKFLHSY